MSLYKKRSCPLPLLHENKNKVNMGIIKAKKNKQNSSFEFFYTIGFLMISWGKEVT